MKTVPEEILSTFDVSSEPSCFQTGQGGTFHCGDKILKPTDNREESEWLAETFASLDKQETFRFPRPIKSTEGNWVENGWVAWTYLQGDVSFTGNHEERFGVCDDFHKMLEPISKPGFLEKRDDPWSIADRVAWQEVGIQHNDFAEFVNDVLQSLRPVSVTNQLVHGDLWGNILFSEKTKPAVIDFSLYWRPVDFAKAVMVVDAVAYGDANKSIFRFLETNDSTQLILRALLRRIVEQVEHVRQFGKDKDEAIREIMHLRDVLNLL